MVKLKTATRNILPSSILGLQEQRKYPKEDRGHQIAAEGRATAMEHKSELIPAQAGRIRVKANRLLGNKLIFQNSVVNTVMINNLNQLPAFAGELYKLPVCPFVKGVGTALQKDEFVLRYLSRFDSGCGRCENDPAHQAQKESQAQASVHCKHTPSVPR
jgi:hypothetical protein